MPLTLAAAVVLTVVALASFAVRLHGRRQRRRSRREQRVLTRAFRRFLDGGETAAALARAADRVDEGSYWTVLETLSLKLNRARWLRLSRALVNSRHAATERRALSDDSPWRQVLACRRLALLRSRASWRALRRAMTRGGEMVTLAAATALARYHDRGALRWILSHQEAVAHRHRNALAALMRTFGTRGLPVLARALERGISNTRVELAVVDALGVAGYRDACPPIERRLAHGDLDMRAAAARSLGLMGAVECGTSLMAALRDDAWQVRAQAARALGRVRALVAAEALAGRLTDRSWWVRHHAAYALMELGEMGQATLRHVIATSDDPYARDMAREALDRELKRLAA